MTCTGSVIPTKRAFVVAVCVAAGAGCASPEPPSRAEDAATTARPDFEAATTAFHQALRTNNRDSLFAYVADDVLMMPPGEAPVRGKNAMRDWYSTFLSQYRTSSLTLSNREVFVSDGWAVELGTYEWALTPVAGGNPILDRGNYMQVWKSHRDGQWRFEREIWNSSVPANTASPM